jgi:hypothetical protein
MSTPNQENELFERYKDFRLVNVGKVCPKCGRVYLMESILTEIPCSCGRLVTFTVPERRHVILTEIIPLSQVDMDAVER